MNNLQYSSNQSKIDAELRLESANLFLSSEARRIQSRQSIGNSRDDISITSEVGLKKMIDGHAKTLLGILSA